MLPLKGNGFNELEKSANLVPRRSLRLNNKLSNLNPKESDLNAIIGIECAKTTDSDLPECDVSALKLVADPSTTIECSKFSSNLNGTKNLLLAQSSVGRSLRLDNKLGSLPTLAEIDSDEDLFKAKDDNEKSISENGLKSTNEISSAKDSGSESKSKEPINEINKEEKVEEAEEKCITQEERMETEAKCIETKEKCLETEETRLQTEGKIESEEKCQPKENSDIISQIDRLIEDHSHSDEESSLDDNSFIDFEAEEGEEDTPSDGSNDIPEKGEYINTTESEYSSDGSYDRNSFIDDDGTHELLSGNEFDLSLEENKRPSRIIELSSGSDDEIIVLERFKKPVKKRKKSRIIKMLDSSDEDVDGGFVDLSSDTEQKLIELCSESCDETPDNEIKMKSENLLENTTVEDCKKSTLENTDGEGKNISNCSQNYIENKTIADNKDNDILIREDVLSKTPDKKEENHPVMDEEISEINTNEKIKIIQFVQIENTDLTVPENVEKNNEPKICVFTQYEEENNLYYKQNRKRKLKTNAPNKRKKIKLDKKITKMGILEDALHDQQKNLLENNHYHDVPNDHVLKANVSSNSVKNKPKSVNKLWNKFHHKDFKNMMIYNNKRVKRIDTSSMLKRNFF